MFLFCFLPSSGTVICDLFSSPTVLGASLSLRTQSSPQTRVTLAVTRREPKESGDREMPKYPKLVCVCGKALSRPPPATLQTPTPTPLPGGHGLPNTRPTDAALSNDPYITNPFPTRTPSRLAANGRQRGPELCNLCFAYKPVKTRWSTWVYVLGSTTFPQPKAADKPRS